MNLILGRAGVGKNRYVMEALVGRAKEGQRALLIVPEQSSFSYEKKLLLLLGPKDSQRVEVKSFSRLAEDLLKQSGEGAKARLDDAAKITLVRRAVMESEEGIAYYRRNLRDFSFYALAARVIDEMKNAAVTPEMLGDLSEHPPSALSGVKFREIAAIYANYDRLLSARYTDAADRLTAAAKHVGLEEMARGKALFIDGFTGFTEPEFMMLERLIPAAQAVAATLMCDTADPSGAELFSPVRKTAQRLLAIAKEQGTNVDIVELTEKETMHAKGLSALERFLSGEEAGCESDGVCLIEGEDPYDEVEQVAAEIVWLVRERGYRFSDIAVITRDIEGYRAAVRRMFRMYDIPYFADWTENERFSPVAAFVLAALALLDDLSADNLLALLKTQLSDLPAGEIAALEQYLYVWGSGREQLMQPFEGNPEGPGAEMDAPAREKLALAEGARATAVGWAGEFIDRARHKNANEIVKEIFLLMERCGAVEILNERGDAASAFSLLEQLYLVLGDERLPAPDIAEIASVLFAATFNGEVPESLEQVQVGSAERVRTDAPRVVFVLGLNEGRFPLDNFEAPLLSFSEREFMIENGVPLARNFDGLLQMEGLHFYNALTSASERCYICYPKSALAGEPLQPSARIKEYLDRFAPQRPETAGDRFARVVNLRTAKKAYLEQPTLRADIRSSGLFDFCDRLDAAAEPPRYVLEDARPSERRAVQFSPSQIEDFERCRFHHFLNYTARVRPLRKAAVSPLEAGNFIHAVMEQVFRATGGDLVSADITELRRLTDSASEQYVTEVLLETTARSAEMQYLVGRLKAQARRLVLYLREEQKQSAFKPVDFELSIAPEGDVPPRVLETPDGALVTIVGKVDRVDVAEVNGKKYIRIVDYKTGERKFSLDEVCYGLNMQMLLYLFTLTENGGARYGDALPAGVLYMPSDPKPPQMSDAVSGAEAYRMDGLLLSDIDAVAAMERDVAGIFIPVTTNRDGSFSKNSKIADLAAMGSIKKHIDETVVEMAGLLAAGDIAAEPTVSGNRSPCDYCEYTAVCRRDRILSERAVARGAGEVLKGGGDNV